jgi:hypothetical protein
LICARCGAVDPHFFVVSDEEWQKYIQIVKRGEVIYRPCYDQIKGLIDGHTKRGSEWRIKENEAEAPPAT